MTKKFLLIIVTVLIGMLGLDLIVSNIFPPLGLSFQNLENYKSERHPVYKYTVYADIPKPGFIVKKIRELIQGESYSPMYCMLVTDQGQRVVLPHLSYSGNGCGNTIFSNNTFVYLSAYYDGVQNFDWRLSNDYWFYRTDGLSEKLSLPGDGHVIVSVLNESGDELVLITDKKILRFKIKDNVQRQEIILASELNLYEVLLEYMSPQDMAFTPEVFHKIQELGESADPLVFEFRYDYHEYVDIYTFTLDEESANVQFEFDRQE